VNGKAEQRAWVEKWAQDIEARVGSSIALFLIELARPFGFLGSQVLLISQPLLGGVVGETTLERAATLLDSPDLLDQLSAHLEGDTTE
jgi:hypothetical protein